MENKNDFIYQLSHDKNDNIYSKGYRIVYFYDDYYLDDVSIKETNFGCKKDCTYMGNCWWCGRWCCIGCWCDGIIW